MKTELNSIKIHKSPNREKKVLLAYCVLPQVILSNYFSDPIVSKKEAKQGHYSAWADVVSPAVGEEDAE